MKEIYVLKSRKEDFFGEGTEWKNIGWTDDTKIAVNWKRSSSRSEHRDFDYLKKVG